MSTPDGDGADARQGQSEKLEAQAAQARAARRSAEGRQLQSEATMAEAEAELARLEHVRELSGGRVPSKRGAGFAGGDVKHARADQASATAQVSQSQASLTAIETDIKKAIIRSPISGIVLDRQVDPGQTVAASFQTPTLFTLAQDLTKMKLIVDVDEADIGNVRVGQTANFRVDASPDRSFSSKVSEVRSTPKTLNGVVTYQAVLAARSYETVVLRALQEVEDSLTALAQDAVILPLRPMLHNRPLTFHFSCTTLACATSETSSTRSARCSRCRTQWRRAARRCRAISSGSSRHWAADGARRRCFPETRRLRPEESRPHWSFLDTHSQKVA